jgi:hypothetical protein
VWPIYLISRFGASDTVCSRLPTSSAVKSDAFETLIPPWRGVSNQERRAASLEKVLCLLVGSGVFLSWHQGT